MSFKKARRAIAKGLFRLSGKLSRFAFGLVGDPLTPKQDREKYAMDEEPDEDEEPMGVGAATEAAYDALTPEARAMIVVPITTTEAPDPEPLEGSIEARTKKHW